MRTNAGRLAISARGKRSTEKSVERHADRARQPWFPSRTGECGLGARMETLSYAELMEAAQRAHDLSRAARRRGRMATACKHEQASQKLAQRAARLLASVDRATVLAACDLVDRDADLPR